MEIVENTCTDIIINLYSTTKKFILDPFCKIFKQIHKYYFCNVLGEKVYDSDDEDSNDELLIEYGNLIDDIPEPDVEKYGNYYESSEKNLNKYVNYMANITNNDDISERIKYINV